MLTIGVLAAELGVAPATLRKWESRYGFPRPCRSEGGARFYDASEVARLKDAKRRLDRGQRPAEVFGALALEAQASFLPQRDAAPQPPVVPSLPPEIACLLTLIHEHRLDECDQLLRRSLGAMGVTAFVDELAGPLMAEVGRGWSVGEMRVFEEHGLTSLMHAVLNDAGQPPGSSIVGRRGRSIVLLATPSGELHTLGLSMVQAALRDAGARCINMGAGVPLDELAAAAGAFGAAVVGVSLSSAQSPRLTQRYLTKL
ncbi:MAG: cobalamin-dependent protein [Azoarcus sp.]|nr:cobalamin-dependent protein [Azoarcus sp.]